MLRWGRARSGEGASGTRPHTSVRHVACVPFPAPVTGERMCACGFLRQGHSLPLEALTKFLLDAGMAKFKLPERMELMEDFPLATFGKVSKKALAEGLHVSESKASSA